MARIKIAKGVRTKFSITAKDENGDPLNLTGKKFGFVVFKQPSETLVRFAYPAKTNWTTIVADDLSIGKFFITLEPNHTSSADAGNYDAEIVHNISDGVITHINKNPGGKEFIELFDSPTAELLDL